METKALAEIRQHLSKFVDEAVKPHARFDITRNVTRAAVSMSADAARRGQLRVIYRIDEGRVLVVAVGHRRYPDRS